MNGVAKVYLGRFVWDLKSKDGHAEIKRTTLLFPSNTRNLAHPHVAMLNHIIPYVYCRFVYCETAIACSDDG